MRNDQKGALLVMAEMETEIAAGNGVGPRVLEGWLRLLRGQARRVGDPHQLRIPDFNEFGRPAQARELGPETSKAAAGSWNGEMLRGARLKALRLLARHGEMTDHQLHAVWESTYGRVAFSTPAKRRGDLVEHGLVRYAQRDSRTPSGRWAMRWAITDAGRQRLEAEEERLRKEELARVAREG